MHILIVFEPDAELLDPSDPAAQPISRGVSIPPDTDVFIAWREWGAQFEDGARTHIVTGGSWENVPDDLREEVFALLMRGEVPA